MVLFMLSSIIQLEELDMYEDGERITVSHFIEIQSRKEKPNKTQIQNQILKGFCSKGLKCGGVLEWKDEG